MENKDDKNIEILVEKLMQESPMETPSANFTSVVMDGVFSLEKKKSFLYKPAISTRSWIIIFAAIGSVICWILYNANNLNGMSETNLFRINSDKIYNLFSEFRLQGVTTVILLSALVMLFIQLILLSSYLNKKIHK